MEKGKGTRDKGQETKDKGQRTSLCSMFHQRSGPSSSLDLKISRFQDTKVSRHMNYFKRSPILFHELLRLRNLISTYIWDMTLVTRGFEYAIAPQPPNS